MHLRSLIFTALAGLAPQLAVAQAMRPSITNVRLLVVPVWTTPDSTLDSLVAVATLRLRQRTDSRDITALSWHILERSFPIPEPMPPLPTLSGDDLSDFGEQFGADLVLAIRRVPGSAFAILPTLVRGSPLPVAWSPLRGTTLSILADTLVARIASDSTLQRWRGASEECRAIDRGPITVDRAAAFIGDTLADLRPALPGVSGKSVVRFVVDSLGRVDLPTLVLVRPSGAVTLEEIAVTARAWRFMPAFRGKCPVRQRLEVQLTR